jgi:hypothetical protein
MKHTISNIPHKKLFQVLSDLSYETGIIKISAIKDEYGI